MQTKSKILSKIDVEIRKLSNFKRILKGNVYKVLKQCANKKCKCHNGQKHEVYQLTFKKEKNITQTLYVKKNKLPEVKKFINNYKKAKKIFDNILELNSQLIKLS